MNKNIFQRGAARSITIAFLLSLSFAANKIPVSSFNVEQLTLQSNVKELHQIIGLKSAEDLKAFSSIKTASGTEKNRYQQYHAGIHIYGLSIVANKTQSGRFNQRRGTLVQNIFSDLPNVRATLTGAEALAIGKRKAPDRYQW